MTTIDLGLVQGAFVGVTPPANTSITWIDTRTSPYISRVYNFALPGPYINQWQSIANSSNISVLSSSITLNQSQINALNDTPQQIIVSPGSGFAIQISGIYLKY